MKRALLLLLPLVGCAPDLIEPWEVDAPRLMGARVEVDGDRARPRPKLGERFDVRFFIALPAGNFPTPLPGRYAFDAAVCLGFTTSTGALACVGEQELNPTTTVISDSEALVSGLSFDLSALGQLGITPDQLQGLDPNVLAGLGKLDELTLFGVFCVDGTPERVPGKTAAEDAPSELYRCLPNPGAPFPAPVAFALPVSLDLNLPTSPNRNPSFACDPASPDSACNLGLVSEDELQVPGAFVIARPAPKKGQTGPREVVAWPAREPTSPLPWDACAADPTLVQVRAKSGEHRLRARFDPSDREPYKATLSVNGVEQLRDQRESLYMTHAVTLHAGDLGRWDSRLDAQDPDPEAEITFRWTPPERGEDVASIPENGRLVRFYFTLRDERGGVDFTTRELCLLPAAP